MYIHFNFLCLSFFDFISIKSRYLLLNLLIFFQKSCMFVY